MISECTRCRQLKVLRQLLAAGFIDQVAIRKDLVLKDSASGDQYTTSSSIPYQALGIAEDVYIHPSSVLTTTLPPDFIVFHEVIKTSRVWLKGGLASVVSFRCHLTLISTRLYRDQRGLVVVFREVIFVHVLKASEEQCWKSCGNTEIRSSRMGTASNKRICIMIGQFNPKRVPRMLC